MSGRSRRWGRTRKSARQGLAIQADSGEAEALTRAVEEAADKLGSINIFVSSTGALLFKPIEEFTLEDFNRVVEVDLKPAYVGSEAVLGHMGKGARIVFISSNI